LAQIIDGKAVAQELRDNVSKKVNELVTEKSIQPGLAVVIVGENPASLVYVGNKEKAAIKAGIKSFVHRLPENTNQEELLKLVRILNEDKSVNGILVQLPLPDHINETAVVEAISPAKDVDGLNSVNVGSLASGNDAMAPCTPLGCVILAKKVLGKLEGLHAVIIGRSNLVGKPMAELLLRENCTITICHSRTKNMEDITKTADILVVATGKPNLVKKSWVKSGAVVIDVGINRMPDRKLAGDVDFNDVFEVAGHITPVPGGVGPMTIACLMANTLTATCKQNNLEVPHIV